MQKIRVVFVSRRNSLRSILAAACLSHLGHQRFSVYSCGQPGQIARAVHPAALGALSSASIPLPRSDLRSWDKFTRSGVPWLDFVITLDSSTVLSQPRWPGQPDAAVWPYEPPTTTPRRRPTPRSKCATPCGVAWSCWSICPCADWTGLPSARTCETSGTCVEWSPKRQKKTDHTRVNRDAGAKPVPWRPPRSQPTSSRGTERPSSEAAWRPSPAKHWRSLALATMKRRG